MAKRPPSSGCLLLHHSGSCTGSKYSRSRLLTTKSSVRSFRFGARILVRSGCVARYRIISASGRFAKLMDSSDLECFDRMEGSGSTI